MAQREAKGRIRILRPTTALPLLLLFSASTAFGYSVLTHEAIIDSTWDGAIRPLLLKRFPLATAEELTTWPLSIRRLTGIVNCFPNRMRVILSCRMTILTWERPLRRGNIH
jgi:hypothetical protein